MRIGFAADHGGLAPEPLLASSRKRHGHEVVDLGARDEIGGAEPLG